VKIAFLCRPPTGRRSLTTGVVALLEEWGARVDLIHPDADPQGVVGLEHDLYVLRTVNTATLRYAAALDALGAVLANPYPVSRLCRERDRLAALLGAAGVPLGHAEGQDVRERKLYCIGGQVFGVQRRWPAATDEQKRGEPFTVAPELRDIVLTVGQVVGLELYGVDATIGADGPSVLAVNPFPGFKGVPQAALRVADYLYAAAAAAMARTAPAEAAR
jgi:hypothetical protein